MAITRADVAALIEEEYNHDLIDNAVALSTAGQTFRTVQMGTKVMNMPVLATLPEAQWVGDTDATRTKPESKATWDKKNLTAAELAVIVRINEEDLEDATEDLLTHITALGSQAMGKALDEAVFFGTNKPASWTSAALLPAAVAAGQVFQAGTGANDLPGSFFQAAGAVADSGYNPDTIVAGNALRFQLANVRDANGSPIYLPSLSAAPGSTDNVAGLDAQWNKNGAWDRALAHALVFDSSRVILGIRTDIQVKFLDQATVGGVSLAENDQVALRFRARFAYALGDAVTTTGEVGKPVAAVTPAAVTP